MSHYTYNEFHLGDNLVHLHFLRALARLKPEHVFIHAVHECHLKQLEEVVADVENLRLIPLPLREKYAPLGAWINTWKNADEFWARHPVRHDWVEFHLSWFAYLSHKLGLPCPFHTAKDFLFDYPALDGELNRYVDANFKPAFDFLIINSQPCSGQLKPYDGAAYFTPLCEALVAKGHSVITTDELLRTCPAGHTGPLPPAIPCTRTMGLSITGVGTISRRCKNIIAVATGPLWPCLNVWNAKTPIIILLDHLCGEELLTGLGANITQVKSREAVLEILKQKQLL
jgi:hypothetical protein